MYLTFSDFGRFDRLLGFLVSEKLNIGNFSECNESFSNQIQPVDSQTQANQELISTDQLANKKPVKSTQTKYPKYISFDLTEDTESFKIRSKLNDFHQNIEQLYKILLANQSSDSQLPQAKLSHLELKLNQMKKEILVLLYTNPEPGFRKNQQSYLC